MNRCVARFDPLARTAIHGYFYIEFSVTRKKGRNERSKKEKREKIHMTASVRGLRHSCLFSRWSYYQIKRNLILNKFTGRLHSLYTEIYFVQICVLRRTVKATNQLDVKKIFNIDNATM